MNTTGKFQQEAQVTADVMRLDQKYFPNPWTDQQWLEMNPDQNHVFTWKAHNKLVGYALFQFLVGDDTAHLLKLLIIPEQRGSSDAKEFWSCILSFLQSSGIKSIYLEVEASNSRAIRFYEKCGLQLLRRNKAYYSSGEDALIMTLTL